MRTLAGIKPLSLYVLTIAESGEGKTTGDGVALHAISEYEQKAAVDYKREYERVERQRSAAKKGAPKPELPREPYLITRDGTVEGIRNSFRDGLPSQGVFTSEAAMMLAGYGMNAENRGKTAAVFNSLWDDGEISVCRSLSGRIHLYARRLSIHWLIQPEAARSALHDPLLSAIGFWPRFLTAWPLPSAPREARVFNPGGDSWIRDYWERCRTLLAHALGEDCGGLPIIETDNEALALIKKFFERMERAAKSPGGVLIPIKPFAIRATEQVFRVAGGLTVFANKQQCPWAFFCGREIR